VTRGRSRLHGFTLIEVLIVVAIIAIIVAIAIPALQRARVSANESAAIGDIRTVISGQAAYHSANGGFYEKNFSCLGKQGGCIPNAPTTGPSFLDSQLASLQPKGGYARVAPQFGDPPSTPNADVSPSSVDAYVYAAVPQLPGRTGVRGFAGDHSGRLCETANGTVPPMDGKGSLDRTCSPFKQ
jgi:prepilin-type N-terminal cleavage/methylation domain-containing protein